MGSNGANSKKLAIMLKFILLLLPMLMFLLLFAHKQPFLHLQSLRFPLPIFA